MAIADLVLSHIVHCFPETVAALICAYAESRPIALRLLLPASWLSEIDMRIVLNAWQISAWWALNRVHIGPVAGRVWRTGNYSINGVRRESAFWNLYPAVPRDRRHHRTLLLMKGMIQVAVWACAG